MKSYYPVDVKPIDDFRLILTFDNGEARLFDVTPYLDDVFFSPLRDVKVFNTVRVNPISIEWDGGIDICPDELYYNSEALQPGMYGEQGALVSDQPFTHNV